jgi:hypothetical protein
MRRLEVGYQAVARHAMKTTGAERNLAEFAESIESLAADGFDESFV